LAAECCMFFSFFFSSRRRHTRFSRDWSSDVCFPICVAGNRWSPQSYVLKDFLSRTQTPYEWVDLDVDAATRELVEQHTPGLKELPVVFFPDGTVLLAPSTQELAVRLGLQTAASRDFYDL